MLWRKGWWETRWEFSTLLGLTLLLVALHEPWEQPDLTRRALWFQRYEPELDENTRRFVTLLITYSGYVWNRWFGFYLPLIWSPCAIMMATTLIKSSCPMMKGPQGAAGFFTSSLPVSRRKPLLTHSAVVAIEMILIALVPSLMYTIAIRLTGGEVPLGSTVIYALLLALGGMVLVAFTFLLMIIFNSQWKALTIGIFIALALRLPSHLSYRLPASLHEEYPWWHIYHVMSGETYFRYGRIPWLGLLASLAVSALIMFAAVRIYERRDF